MMLLAFAVGHDWGRYIHLFVLHVAIVQLCLGEAVAISRTPAKRADDLRSLAIGAIPIAYYGLGWTLLQFVPRGGSALTPGPLFFLYR